MSSYPSIYTHENSKLLSSLSKRGLNTNITYTNLSTTNRTTKLSNPTKNTNTNNKTSVSTSNLTSKTTITTTANLGSSYAFINAPTTTFPNSSNIFHIGASLPSKPNNFKVQASVGRGNEETGYSMDLTDMEQLLTKLQIEYQVLIKDRDNMKNDALLIEEQAAEKYKIVQNLANTKGLEWNGSAWVIPPKESEVDDDSIALQAAILDLHVRNKLLTQNIKDMDAYTSKMRNKLLDKVQSDESRPVTKFQMIHELEQCSDRIEQQRLDYASKKAEHENIIAEMFKLQSASKEELDSYNIQIDQTAAIYFDTKTRLEAKCAAIQSLVDDKFDLIKQYPDLKRNVQDTKLQDYLDEVDKKLEKLASLTIN